MESRIGKPPAGVTLSPLAERVFTVLAEYTAFPWPVLLAQTRRLGIDPAQLHREDLRELIPLLSKGVERFTSPQKGLAVRDELEALLSP